MLRSKPKPEWKGVRVLANGRLDGRSVRSKPKACAQCGKVFILSGGGGGRKFCSWGCFQAAFPRTTVKCAGCGRLFSRVQSRLGPEKNYCSRKCQAGLRRTLTCKKCGSEFTIPPSLARNHSYQYCSRKCKDAERFMWTTFTCTNCGKEYEHLKPASTRRGKNHYCSRACQSNHMRGARHPLWRGNRRHDRGPTWTANRAEARRRDRDTCQSCGAASEPTQKVSVDHIVPFRLTLRYGAQDGIDPNHLDNLICLCRKCHARKTQAERRLLRGDVVGFRDAVRAMIPAHRSEKALALWALAKSKQDSLFAAPEMPKWMEKRPKPIKTHCKYGHPYDESNTGIRPNGKRYCRACHHIQGTKWAAAHRSGAHIPAKVVPAKPDEAELKRLLGMEP